MCFLFFHVFFHSFHSCPMFFFHVFQGFKGFSMFFQWFPNGFSIVSTSLPRFFHVFFHSFYRFSLVFPRFSTGFPCLLAPIPTMAPLPRVPVPRPGATLQPAPLPSQALMRHVVVHAPLVPDLPLELVPVTWCGRALQGWKSGENQQLSNKSDEKMMKLIVVNNDL